MERLSTPLIALGIKNSRAFASASAGRNCEERAKGIIDRLRIWESSRHLGIEEHNIGPLTVTADILASNATREIILRPHLR